MAIFFKCYLSVARRKFQISKKILFTCKLLKNLHVKNVQVSFLKEEENV